MAPVTSAFVARFDLRALRAPAFRLRDFVFCEVVIRGMDCTFPLEFPYAFPVQVGSCHGGKGRGLKRPIRDEGAESYILYPIGCTIRSASVHSRGGVRGVARARGRVRRAGRSR
nr:hypothetical protein GCM10025732_06050 [Glycomyces mayteni]